MCLEWSHLCFPLQSDWDRGVVVLSLNPFQLQNNHLVTTQASAAGFIRDVDAAECFGDTRK